MICTFFTSAKSVLYGLQIKLAKRKTLIADRFSVSKLKHRKLIKNQNVTKPRKFNKMKSTFLMTLCEGEGKQK